MVKKEALKEKPKKSVKKPVKNASKPANKAKKPAIKKTLTLKTSAKQASQPTKKTAKIALKPEIGEQKSLRKPPIASVQPLVPSPPNGGNNHQSSHRRPLIMFPK
jgi:hypothetical protein